MFSALSNTELCALFIRIKSGRDKTYYTVGAAGNAVFFIMMELNDIMNEIHSENSTR